MPVRPGSPCVCPSRQLAVRGRFQGWATHGVRGALAALWSLDLPDGRPRPFGALDGFLRAITSPGRNVGTEPTSAPSGSALERRSRHPCDSDRRHRHRSADTQPRASAHGCNRAVAVVYAARRSSSHGLQIRTTVTFAASRFRSTFSSISWPSKMKPGSSRSRASIRPSILRLTRFS